MSLFDRLTRRPSGPEAGPTARSAAADAHALERYEKMLASAPPAVVEGVHAKAFERLSPEQRKAVFDRLSDAASADERPADASPGALARAASRAEARERGAVARMLGTDAHGAALSSAVGAAILGAVAAYAASSAVWEAWAADGDEEGAYGGGGGIGEFGF
jgi:hypothetical protein